MNYYAEPEPPTREEEDADAWNYWRERANKAEDQLLSLKSETDALLTALKDMFALMDEGLLVRDISDDDKPLWAMRQLDFVRRLQKAQAAIANTVVRT